MYNQHTHIILEKKDENYARKAGSNFSSKLFVYHINLLLSINMENMELQQQSR